MLLKTPKLYITHVPQGFQRPQASTETCCYDRAEAKSFLQKGAILAGKMIPRPIAVSCTHLEVSSGWPYMAKTVFRFFLEISFFDFVLSMLERWWDYCYGSSAGLE